MGYIVVVVGFRKRLGEEVTAELVGLKRAGEVAAGHKQKYEENEEEGDLPRRRRRRQ